ncbi:site-specific tyrosine recombinase XerD [Streptococcus sobrinus]|uniref:site-specific tyrosine recombinase XerD n=1 Tax=Streptococcus sobrinus TaxID=1310 RepID=UPI000308741C|nr:site-specific tyrosine recombinase XerD [Streptococcus sobrinus]OZV23142.1 site-specific tyrosine recombinase XerD [Streptococcus sobrinus]
MNQLTQSLKDFIASKDLSENSRRSYLYDLQQFSQQVDGQISASKIKLYQQSLGELKPSARKRKLSSVNQFLLYLYEAGQVDSYHRLKSHEKVRAEAKKQEALDLTVFAQANSSPGKWMALLILELGLTPSEMAGIKLADLDLEFQVIRLQKADQVRILPLPEVLLTWLGQLKGDLAEQTYIFDKKGQPYSRQWFFNQLNEFLAQVGFPDLTAQKLREQYILREVQKGTSLLDLAKKLGLKSPLTLEHYYKNGY